MKYKLLIALICLCINNIAVAAVQNPTNTQKLPPSVLDIGPVSTGDTNFFNIDGQYQVVNGEIVPLDPKSNIKYDPIKSGSANPDTPPVSPSPLNDAGNQGTMSPNGDVRQRENIAAAQAEQKRLEDEMRAMITPKPKDTENVSNSFVAQDNNTIIVPEPTVLLSMFNKGVERMKNYQLDSSPNIIYKMTDRQLAAKKQNIPLLKIKKNKSHKYQIIPPNIGQKDYIRSNQHLPPVMMDSDIIRAIFNSINHRTNLSIIRACLNTIDDINIMDHKGRTMLYMASLYGDAELALLLLYYGIDVNLSNISHVAPIHLAVQTDNILIASLLITYKAKLNVQDDLGNTPLIYAIITKNLDMVTMLLLNGADVNIKNQDGLNALDWIFIMNDDNIANIVNSILNEQSK